MRLHVRAADVRPGRLVLIALSVLFALVLSRAVQAQSTTDAVYQVPAQAIVDVVDVLPVPSVALGPDREWMLFIQYPSYPPVAELAERELKLAGMRIKPSIDGRSRTTGAIDLSVRRLQDEDVTRVAGLPADPRLVYQYDDGRNRAVGAGGGRRVGQAADGSQPQPHGGERSHVAVGQRDLDRSICSGGQGR